MQLYVISKEIINRWWWWWWWWW